jgi:anti-sigma factor RsiW
MTDHLERGDRQDRLIDLVHGTGSAASRADLAAALAADDDLAAELALLQAARVALTRPAPAIDVDRVVAALPAAPRAQAAPTRQRWRWAAAIATVALGGISLAVVQEGFRGQAGGDLGTTAAESALVASAPVPAALEVTFGQGLSEFDDAELDALFTELAAFDGMVSAEPVRGGAVLPLPIEGGD